MNGCGMQKSMPCHDECYKATVYIRVGARRALQASAGIFARNRTRLNRVKSNASSPAFTTRRIGSFFCGFVCRLLCLQRLLDIVSGQ